MSSDNEKAKRKFRNTKTWKSFRHQMNVRDKGRDYLTGNKLIKGYELHHMDLNPNNYQNLNEENFVSLNKFSHKFIHWIYRYYEKDRTIIDRLTNILDRMIDLNK